MRVLVEGKIVKDYIYEVEESSAKERLSKLKDAGAPQILLDSAEKVLSAIESDTLEIGGDTSLLDVEVEGTPEIRQGRGGKSYIQFNGYINYFPQARFGRFITTAKR